MLKRDDRIRVGISMGDPSGIGPEIIAKSLGQFSDFVEIVLVGDRWVFDQLFANNYLRHNNLRKPPAVKFINLNNVPRKNFSFGKTRAEYGKAAVEYLAKSIELLQDKRIDCLVTGPVSKESVNLAGINFSGHTEYLARHTGTDNFVMMLMNRKLKISLVTRHIPIRKVSGALTRKKIYNTIRISGESLRNIFAVKNPSIVVAGVNPHASDNGVIGNEENLIIKPALNMLKGFAGSVDGPLAADVAILKAQEKKYDCVVVMYHDQALIPLKQSGASFGVNITLGLPFIRTSPLHGTAFDIAGKNLADPVSFLEAVRVAIKCTKNQRRA